MENVNTVLAIELMVALQALDFRAIPSSPVIDSIRLEIRKSIPTLQGDRVLYPDIEFLKSWLKTNTLHQIITEKWELL